MVLPHRYLAGWVTGWLADPRIDLLSGWLARYLTGWLLGLLTDGLDLLTRWQTEKLAGWLKFGLTDWLTDDGFPGWMAMVCCIAESLGDRLTGSLTNCGKICFVSCSLALASSCTVSVFCLLSICLSICLSFFLHQWKGSWSGLQGSCATLVFLVIVLSSTLAVQTLGSERISVKTTPIHTLLVRTLYQVILFSLRLILTLTTKSVIPRLTLM